MESNKNELLYEALKYLELGLSIFPAQGKQPMVSWKKYEKEKPSKEQVVEWWTKWPNANIAAATGAISGIVVIDIDGGEVPSGLVLTPTSQTSPGRYHYYYKHPGFEVPNSASVIAPGVDVRGDGGLIILPPSKHFNKVTNIPDGNYLWLISPEKEAFAALPQWILDKVKTKKPIEEIVQGSTQGTRNNDAATIAGSLLARYPQTEWENVCWDLLKAWNTTNTPLLPESELRTVFDSISQRERNKKVSGTQTPEGINKQKLLDKQITYQEVEEKVLRLLPNSQRALKLVLAVAASSSFPNPLMLWLLLVGVPSSGKTDMVRLIRDADSTYYLDNLTQNAFVSGERSSKENKVHDLLPLLDKKCLVIKDWTSIFSLDEKMTKKLLGDLVGIYDKEFTKFSSRRGNISYASAFSQLGCITPATLNRHTNYMNMVGPRFLCYTMPSTAPEEEDRSYDLIFSNQDRSLIEKEARLYVSSYLTQLIKKPFAIKPITREVQDYLRRSARLMSNCRGIVLLQAASFKNEEGDEVKYFEVLDIQIEEPWRAVQQLITLAKYLSFVVGKDEISVEELQIIKEIVVSSMPADRSQALRTIKEHDGQITAKELADLSDKSTKTSRRLLDELVALKALEKISSTARNIAADYQICEQFKDFVLLDPAEFMSPKESRGTETPGGIDNRSLSEQHSVINTLPGLEDYGY